MKIYFNIQQDCQNRLRTKKGKTFKLHESFVCAGGSPKGGDTCEGDGGGPLVCPVKGSGGDRYIQVIFFAMYTDSDLWLISLIIIYDAKSLNKFRFIFVRGVTEN